MIGKRDNKFALYIATGKLLAMATQFVMPMFLTRFLTKSDYGLYAQFYLALNFLGAILCFGIPSNLFYFYEHKKGIEQMQVVWNTFVATMMFGLLGVTIVAIPPIGKYFIGNDLYQYFYIFIICLFLFIPSHIINTLPVVRKDKITTTLFPPIDIFLKVILVISFALIFNSIEGIFMAITILQSIIVMFLFFYIKRNYPINRNALSLSILKEQISYSLPFGVAVALNTVCSRIDKLVCISYLSVEEYATYSVAFFGIPGIMQIYDSICQTNVQNMAFEYRKQPSNVITIYKDFIIKTLSFSVPIIFVVCIFSKQIVTFLFTEKYVESTVYFQLYIFTFIFGMLGSGTILRATGKTRYSMYVYLISSMICIPCTYILIIKWSINGAICSALINTILPKILQIIIEMKLSKFSFKIYFPLKSILKIFLIATSLIIPIWLFNHYCNLRIIYCIVVAIIYISIVYAIELQYNVFIVNKDDLNKMIKTIKLPKINVVK